MQQSTITIYVGQYLQKEDFASWQDISNFIEEDKPNGGHRLPKEEIVVVLESLNLAGFLNKVGELYTFAHKNVKVENVTKNIVPFAELGMPGYASEI